MNLMPLVLILVASLGPVTVQYDYNASQTAVEHDYGEWHCDQPVASTCVIVLRSVAPEALAHEFADVYGFVHWRMPDDTFSIEALADPENAIKRVENGR